MFFNINEGTVSINGTDIDYISFGKGNIPLIIIPGLTLRGVKGAGFLTAYMYRIFSKEFRVYVFDKRNSVPEGFTVHDLAEDIHFCISFLGIQKAHIFGASLGGMISMDLAINHPEDVKTLTLAVTASKINDTIINSVNTWVNYARNSDLSAIVNDMMPKMYSEKYIKKYRILLPLLAKITKLDFHRFINLAKACLTADTYDRLNNITCPTFVIGGMKDRITSPEGCYEIAEILGCEIYMYEEYGHAAYEEAKDFNRRVYEFLKK